jgi:hypothetical protein
LEGFSIASKATNRIVKGILTSALTDANAPDTIRFNFEGHSNKIDESDAQSEKHFDPRISTLLGIKIDLSDDNENADDSIRFNCEFDSNVIDESERQFEKHFDPRISTFLGINIKMDFKLLQSRSNGLKNQLIEERAKGRIDTV